MVLRRLLPILLILLQSGVAAAHAHGHVHASNANNAQVPHVHFHDLIDLAAPDQADQGQHDRDDHDSDAVNVSELLVSTPPPAVEYASPELGLVAIEPAVRVSFDRSFPVGLPPSTAGPHRPRYLTFCVLTI